MCYEIIAKYNAKNSHACKKSHLGLLQKERTCSQVVHKPKIKYHTVHGKGQGMSALVLYTASSLLQH